MAHDRIEIDWLRRWAGYSPRAIALRCADSGRSFSYLELFERSSALAARLRSLQGIRRGDRVALLATNEPETIFLFFALQRLGAILVPVNFRLAPREVEHVLRDSEPALFVYQEEFRATVEGLGWRPARALPFEGEAGLCGLLFSEGMAEVLEMDAGFESPVMILYTSGTTGAPKGALVTHKMLFWNSVSTGLSLSLTQRDSAVIFHPFFHTSGWNVLTTPFLHHGARVTLLKKFDPSRVLHLCGEEAATILFGVPTMMDRMARCDAFPSAKLASLRYAVVGGEPMPASLIETWAARGVPVRQGFGLTEFGPNVFSLGEADALRKKGSIGFPNFYVDVKIIDPGSGSDLDEPGAVGELCLRGPACTPGYWRNEAATAESIRGGWLRTGDLVRRDEEGFFYVAGRRKEMFISGGENVYPVEVERFLRTLPDIREVAVVGRKDPEWGESGCCFYATESGSPLSETELKRLCAEGLAKYKVPKAFVHMPELPKGESGKILKRALVVPA